MPARGFHNTRIVRNRAFKHAFACVCVSAIMAFAYVLCMCKFSAK